MKRSGAVVIAGVVLICAVLGSLAQGTVIYVKSSATGANTGASWIDAYTSLQSGLDAAEPNSNTEIWVAAGTYKPTKKVDGTTERHRAFQLKNGVGVYGGFSGTETGLEQRNWELNPTILSGDLNGNDNQNIVYNEPTRQDNCCHVFYHDAPNVLDNTAILDGCVITGGNADYVVYQHDCGGGMYNGESSNPTIRNCKFRGNSAEIHGGGMYNLSSSTPVIMNCVFMDNSATYGGGMENISNALVVNCVFNKNLALAKGGGMCNISSSPTITRCIFSNNISAVAGGGVKNNTNASPIMTNCIMFNNQSATNGGGIHNSSYSKPTIINCTLSGNSASTDGGGVFNSVYSCPTIINSILWGNTASSGPQIYSSSNSASVVSYSDIQGGWTGTGNINLNPLFNDILNEDLRLLGESPCLDRGSNDAVPSDITTDLDGYSRITDGDGNGTATVDMGAYEYGPDFSVAMPSFNIAGGQYNNEQTVIITCVTANAIIHYTTNGMDPTESDPVIASGSSITVDRSMTLKAKAWKGAMAPSPVKSAVYTLVVSTPTFSRNGGTYHSEQAVTITCATPEAVIHYTISDDPNIVSDPTESDPVISSGSSIFVDHTMVVKAKAWKKAMTPSAVQSATYTLVVATPVFSKTGGTYTTEQMVTITCATPGTMIRYTLDGSDPDGGIVYDPNVPVYVDHTLTLKARAWKGSSLSSAIQSATYTLVVATPKLSKNGGTYNQEQTVTITCATPGATIHYTTNGVDPTESDPVVASGSSITVDRSMTLKARAWKGAMTPSAVVSGVFTMVVAIPTFSKSGGTYDTEQTVVITCSTAGATIHYTTNGVDPTENDLVIVSGGSILVDRSMTLKVRAYKEGWDPCVVKSATYVLLISMPVFSKAGGTYNNEQAVTISCSTAGATIHYTTNGVDPTENDLVIASGGSILVDQSMTLKAKAWKGVIAPSAVQSATYTLVVAMPKFSKTGGTYNQERTVTITCATPGATIRYTLDGSNPDDGIVYDPNVPVYVDHTLILKAKAWKGVMTPSAVKSATYTLVTGTPVFSKAEGTYHDELTVEMTCATPGATIRYTLDGSDPNDGMIYDPNVPVFVDHTLTLKAKAWREGLPESAVRSAVYTLVAATPEFTPDEGRYSEDQIVTITCATPGAAIYYTTDGSDPTQENMIVEQGGTVIVSIEPETLLKAIAYKADFQPSSIKQARYRLSDIIYVNASATGVNTGASWTDAYTSLQSGLDAVEPNSPAEIWVAAGTYKPTREIEVTGSRYRSFQMKKMVGIYGGFAGTETRRKQRDWEANSTILSGDLNGDDNDVVLPTEPTRQDNCYHVIYNNDPNGLNSTAILDGFVITGGNAYSPNGHYCHSGGGVYNGSSSSPTIARCIFRHNTASYNGGGIHNSSYSSPLITECSFIENYSVDGGGGIHQVGNSSPVIRRCVFVGNRSGVNGGGIYNEEHCSSVIDQCIFHDNSATYGGGIRNISSSPTVINCIFSGNSATEGGGVYNRFSDVTIVNCTFWGNSAQLSGGGISLSNSGHLTRIANSIFWNNTAPSGPQLDQPDSLFIVSYTNIEGGWAGTGNINQDPKFISDDPNTFDLRLQTGSPCIDAGNNGAIPAGILSDLDGTLRMIDADCDGNAVVDMGAYEYFLPGDLNFNCGVDITDFDVLSDHMLQGGCTCPTNCGQADIDRNGDVEQADLVLFIEQWLQWENIALAPLPSPVVWWKLDETDGNAVADYAGGHEGRTVNVTGASWTAGRFNNAFRLDGVDDYAEALEYQGICGRTSRTCTAWIKTSVVGKDQTIMSWGTSTDGQKWMLRLQGDGKPAAGVWGGYIQGNAFVADGQWHHVAAVLMDDGSPNVEEIKLYVDGIPQMVTYSMALMIDTIAGQYVQIGSVYNGAIQTSFFQGLIDDIRIYDVPLTQEEILRLAME